MVANLSKPDFQTVQLNNLLLLFTLICFFFPLLEMTYLKNRRDSYYENTKHYIQVCKALQDRCTSISMAGHEWIFAIVILSLIYVHLPSRRILINHRESPSGAERNCRPYLAFLWCHLAETLTAQQCCPSETRFCAVLDNLKMVLSQPIITFIAATSEP